MIMRLVWHQQTESMNGRKCQIKYIHPSKPPQSLQLIRAPHHQIENATLLMFYPSARSCLSCLVHANGRIGASIFGVPDAFESHFQHLFQFNIFLFSPNDLLPSILAIDGLERHFTLTLRHRRYSNNKNQHYPASSRK